MKEGSIFFDYTVVNIAEARTRKIGVDFDEILQRFGLSRKILASARGAYGRSAMQKGYDQNAVIGIMDKTRHETFCTAFMLSPDTYIIETPPMAKTEPATVQQQEEKPQNEDLLLVIEELSKAIRVNTTHVVNLKEEIRTAAKKANTAPDTTDAANAAKAVEDCAMKLITTNRALDAIDNKLNLLYATVQKQENRVNTLTNATLEINNKGKSIVEGVSGILSKLTKLLAIYDRPKAR